MTVNDFILKMENAAAAIGRDGERQVLTAANDLAALVINRIVQTGKDSKGANFSPYSTTQLPAFFYFGKSRTGSGESQIRDKARRKETVSYKDFRTINGLNSDFKNFEFTGTMWRNFRPTSVQVVGGVYRATIEGAIPQEAQKLEWLSDREKKSIVQPSAAELAIIGKNISNWINSLIK